MLLCPENAGQQIPLNHLLGQRRDMMSLAFHFLKMRPVHNHQKAENKQCTSPMCVVIHFPERLYPECGLQFQSSVQWFYLQGLKAKSICIFQLACFINNYRVQNPLIQHILKQNTNFSLPVKIYIYYSCVCVLSRFSCV